MTGNTLLSVKKLAVSFAHRPVIREVSFELATGEILALVGESGCGKSASCLALGGLLPRRIAEVSAESVEFRCKDGEVVDLLNLPMRKLRRIRGGEIAYIFQEPAAALNPVFRIGDQIAEVLALHRPDVSDFRAEIIKLLSDVGIPAPESRINAFPHELSGGMQQRVMIAMALAGNPALLIADEPTTALDVTIQRQILNLISELRQKRHMAILLVTHNLGIVANLADKVAVMYAGDVVEFAPTRQLIENPRHPYTRALLRAVPHLGGADGKLETIPGMVPSPDNFPAGCRFFGRCGEVVDAEKCRTRIPAPCAFGEQLVRCFNCGEEQ